MSLARAWRTSCGLNFLTSFALPIALFHVSTCKDLWLRLWKPLILLRHLRDCVIYNESFATFFKLSLTIKAAELTMLLASADSQLKSLRLWVIIRLKSSNPMLVTCEPTEWSTSLPPPSASSLELHSPLDGWVGTGNTGDEPETKARILFLYDFISHKCDVIGIATLKDHDKLPLLLRLLLLLGLGPFLLLCADVYQFCEPGLLCNDQRGADGLHWPPQKKLRLGTSGFDFGYQAVLQKPSKILWLLLLPESSGCDLCHKSTAMVQLFDMLQTHPSQKLNSNTRYSKTDLLDIHDPLKDWRKLKIFLEGVASFLRGRQTSPPSPKGKVPLSDLCNHLSYAMSFVLVENILHVYTSVELITAKPGIGWRPANNFSTKSSGSSKSCRNWGYEFFDDSLSSSCKQKTKWYQKL